MFRPKLAIFDLDGTLIEFHLAFLLSQAESIIQRMNHPVVARDELLEHFRNFDFFRFVVEDNREKFVEEFWRLFDWAGFPAPRPIPGAKDALQVIADAGIQVGIATARMCCPMELHDELSQIGLGRSIGHVRTRASEQMHWSDKRETIWGLCRDLGVRPGDALMVGDIPADITSARDVGIGFTVAVMTGGISRESLSRAEPDLILESVIDLPNILILN